MVTNSRQPRRLCLVIHMGEENSLQDPIFALVLHLHSRHLQTCPRQSLQSRCLFEQAARLMCDWNGAQFRHEMLYLRLFETFKKATTKSNLLYRSDSIPS